MNWFKKAYNFDERNIVNHKVLYLKKLRETLDKLSDLVFQSGNITKKTSSNILTGDKITSYPTLRDILIEADSTVLDSPWKFKELCKMAISEIDILISGLDKKRTELTESVRKGWHD